MCVTASEYVKQALKLARFMEKGVITADGYAKNLLFKSCALDEFDAHSVELVAGSVPAAARTALNEVIVEVLSEDYEQPTVHYGGPGPSPSERERLRQLYAKRTRAFALALSQAIQLNSKK